MTILTLPYTATLPDLRALDLPQSAARRCCGYSTGTVCQVPGVVSPLRRDAMVIPATGMVTDVSLAAAPSVRQPAEAARPHVLVQGHRAAGLASRGRCCTEPTRVGSTLWDSRTCHALLTRGDREPPSVRHDRSRAAAAGLSDLLARARTGPADGPHVAQGRRTPGRRHHSQTVRAALDGLGPPPGLRDLPRRPRRLPRIDLPHRSNRRHCEDALDTACGLYLGDRTTWT